jgi:hypothetical protein
MSQISQWNTVALNATNCSASGNNTIIAAPSAGPIKVWKIWFTAGGAVNVTFQSGSTALSGGAVLTASGSSFTLYYDGSPHFVALPGSAFVINLSGAVALTGQVYYTIGG